MLDDLRFSFPETIFVSDNSPGQQLDHVMSEVDEVKKEAEMVAEARAQHDLIWMDKACQDLEMELVDLYHSLETFFRILTVKHGEQYVKDLFSLVMDKNKQRSYYRKG